MPKTKKQRRYHNRHAQAHRPQQDIVTGVPAKLIDEGRKQSHYIIDTLAKTATNLATGEGSGDKVAIIERLWAMQKDAEDRQAEREFGIAKVALAMQLPTIPKNHVISFVDKNNVARETPYADRADIEAVLDVICRKHGFSKEYSTETIDGRACQVLTVRHVGGHKEVFRSPYMPVDSTGSKNNNQAAGSTAEYGKRYALVGAFNIIGVDKDDDGNKGKDPSAPKEDKFAERVAADADKPEAPTSSSALTLPEAAAAVESKIRNSTPEKREAILAKNMRVIDAMEKDAAWHEKAAELRKLCETMDDVKEGKLP